VGLRVGQVEKDEQLTEHRLKLKLKYSMVLDKSPALPGVDGSTDMKVVVVGGVAR
jgi:hypothetical protein